MKDHGIFVKMKGCRCMLVKCTDVVILRGAFRTRAFPRMLLACVDLCVHQPYMLPVEIIRSLGRGSTQCGARAGPELTMYMYHTWY